ncbi:MAG: helix-turn-helix domain-containing protein [Pseudomonadota bacterium]
MLDSAMRTFWRHGYEATSIQDLTDATGLGRGSLYGAFQDKETLFIAALDQYLERSRESWSEALAHPDIREAMRGCLDVLINVLINDRAEAGCFLLLASMSGEERAGKVRRRVLRAFADEERALYDRLRQAEREGDLPDGSDPQTLARFFVAQGRAIGVTARWSADPRTLMDIAETSLAVLGPRKDAA